MCLIVFWVGELGSDDIERFLFSACCIQLLLFGLFVLFCVDERLALVLFVGIFRRASCIVVLLFLFLILVFTFVDSNMFVTEAKVAHRCATITAAVW